MRRGRAAATALALAGLVLLGKGLWIPAKAALAQQLLERAFEAARAEAGDADRPWPWADFVPLARLSAPRLGASAIVVSSATGSALAFGPGHLSASAAPDPGGGNVVIAGHRDTHFRFLRELAPGDLLLLATPRAGPVAYRVVGARVAHETETALLGDSGEPLLTLVTCWPFDAIAPGGPWRFVVVAMPIGAGGGERAPERDQTSANPQRKSLSS